MNVMAGKDPKAEEGVAAVERALSILRAFDERSPALTLAELASRTGLYKSTISRLLVSLRRCGFVERDSLGRHRIGPQAWSVGSLFAVDLTLEKILRPIMEDSLDCHARDGRLLCATARHRAADAHVHTARRSHAPHT